MSVDAPERTTPAQVVPLHQQISCVEQELTLRRRVYDRWVELGANGWTRLRADEEVRAMAAVLATLRQLLHPNLPR
jgi:hypothetical protein